MILSNVLPMIYNVKMCPSHFYNDWTILLHLLVFFKFTDCHFFTRFCNSYLNLTETSAFIKERVYNGIIMSMSIPIYLSIAIILSIHLTICISVQLSYLVHIFYKKVSQRFTSYLATRLFLTRGCVMILI